MLLVSFFIASSLLVPREETITLEPGRLEYLLAYPYIVKNSVSISPSPDSGWLIRDSKLILDKTPVDSLTVVVSYKTLADALYEFSVYEPSSQSRFDSTALKSSEPESVNTGNLGVHGSKTFSLSVTNKGAGDLKQGLTVNLSGNLAGVDVKGYITDEEASFVPEGTTEKIEDFDRINILLSQEKWKLGAGDLDISYPLAGYSPIERRIKGATGEISFGKNTALLAFGIEGTKRGSSGIEPIDGKRGPYFIGRTDSEQPLIPGTEKIWLDGRLLARGRDKDYVIDYATGEVTFSNTLKLESRSRIEAEYVYAGNDYTADNELAGFSSGPLSFFFYREAESRNHLLYSWSAEQQAILDTATSYEAVLPGASFVGEGNGSYFQIGNHYEWVGPGEGDYDVAFRSVDSAAGDYVLNPDSGFFIYAGPSSGNYRAEILTPLPESEELLGLSFDKRFGPASILLSATGSRKMPNLYNTANAMFGHSHQAGFDLRFDRVNLYLTHILQTEHSWLPVEKINANKTDRWNIDTLSSSFNEQEAGVEWSPIDSLSIRVKTGHLWSDSNAWRAESSVRFKFADIYADWLASRWRIRTNLYPRFGFLTPVAGFSWSRYTGKLPNSQAFEPLAGFGITPLPNLSIKTTLSRRIDQKDSAGNKTWLDTLYYDRLALEGTWITDRLETSLVTGFERFIPLGDSNIQAFFGDLRFTYSPSARTKFWLDLSQHLASSLNVRIDYLPVEPGTGDYSKDSTTGEYVADDGGDYKQVVIRETAGTLTLQRFASLGTDLNLNFLRLWTTMDYRSTDSANNLNASSRITILPASDYFSLILYPSYRNQLFPAWGGLRERLESWNVDAEIRSRVHRQYLLRLKASAMNEVRTRAETPLRSRNQWSIALEPILDFWARLEPSLGFGYLVAEEPLYFPELGQIDIQRVWLGVQAEKPCKSWRFKAGFLLTQRQSDVAEDLLPYLISKDNPPGLTPSWNAGIERSLGKGISVRLSYDGALYPDTRGLENKFELSAGMYF